MLSDNPDNRNVSKSDNFIKQATRFSKTDKLLATWYCVGDSIGNSIAEKWLSMNNRNVKVFHFPRARIRDISQLMQPIIEKKAEFLILHVGTKDAETNDSRRIL